MSKYVVYISKIGRIYKIKCKIKKKNGKISEKIIDTKYFMVYMPGLLKANFNIKYI